MGNASMGNYFPIRKTTFGAMRTASRVHAVLGGSHFFMRAIQARADIVTRALYGLIMPLVQANQT